VLDNEGKGAKKYRSFTNLEDIEPNSQPNSEMDASMEVRKKEKNITQKFTSMFRRTNTESKIKTKSNSTTEETNNLKQEERGRQMPSSKTLQPSQLQQQVRIENKSTGFSPPSKTV